MHDARIGVALIAGGFAMSYFLPKLFLKLRSQRKNNWCFAARVCLFFAGLSYTIGLVVSGFGFTAFVAILLVWLRHIGVIL